MKTLTMMLRESAEKYPNRPALRYKDGEKWHDISYDEMQKRVEMLAMSLLGAGLKADDTIAIFSPNRPEWAMADFAIQTIHGVTVPIYATNTPSQVEYILRNAGCRAIFVDSSEQLQPIRALIQANDNIKKIIVFENFSGAGEGLTTDLPTFTAGPVSEELKQAFLQLPQEREPDDIATIIYTSGTTGDPKGVMLTNKNFFHQFDAFEANFDIDSSDRSLCFLPLSHVYERMWSYMVFKFGAANHYISDPRQILEYLKDVRPSVMVSVPRLYEKIYAAVMDKVENAPMFRRALFNWALKTGRKMADIRIGGQHSGPVLAFQHRLADKLVLKKLRDLVGGDKKFFSAGGAPLSKEIEIFFYSVGLLICQGYGLTESSPMISYNSPRAFRFGSVGKPVPGCQVRIDDSGEILVKGDNIMKGYFKNKDATDEMLKDGWLYTGDIGRIDSDGYLYITDRIKDLIITSGGKNIAPQRIESMIGRDHYIEQFVAVGDKRNYITGLLVPNFDALGQWAKDKGISPVEAEDLINNEAVIRFYRERIEKNSEELARYEQVKKFTLLPNAFSQESGELTPSLKVRRNVVNEKYAEQIDKMYS